MQQPVEFAGVVCAVLQLLVWFWNTAPLDETTESRYSICYKPRTIDLHTVSNVF